MSSSQVTVSYVYLIKNKRNNQEIIFIKGSRKKGPEKVYFFQSVTQAGRKKKYNHKKRIFEKSTSECSLSRVSFSESKVKDNPVKEKYK